jgi:L,D-transpeptidase catalytic domain
MEQVGMSRHLHVAHRRVALLAAVLGTSSLVGPGLAGTAFAEDGGGGPPTVADTPCTATARACVDLDDQKAWLIQDGKVIRGPVPISSGGPGKETPLGTFHVISKDKDHKSNEFKLPNGQAAPMPWSVFFQWNGVAFHAGDPERASAGCIHLAESDAIAWFNHLQVGNEVQVHGDDHHDGDNGDDHGDSGDDHHGDDHGDHNGDDHGGDSGDHGGDDHGGDDSGH